MATILIAGGTGLIGKRLSLLLEAAGHTVRHLSRKAQPDAHFPAFSWNPDLGEIDARALEGVQAIINLAGAGIADKPWTNGRKETIISSRVRSTLLLRDALLKHPSKSITYISGAAIGFYGDRGAEWLDENTLPGNGFLSESCMAWENAIKEVAATGVRTVVFRIGLVLSTKGGALPKLLLPLQFGLAPYFGKGTQWYSWIHIDDLCRMFQFAMDQPAMSGIYNACAPHPVPNKAFMHHLSKAYEKTSWIFSTPAPVLRLILGEMADTVLYSSRVSTEKIIQAGFHFTHPVLEEAVRNLRTQQV